MLAAPSGRVHKTEAIDCAAGQCYPEVNLTNNPLLLGMSELVVIGVGVDMFVELRRFVEVDIINFLSDHFLANDSNLGSHTGGIRLIIMKTTTPKEWQMSESELSFLIALQMPALANSASSYLGLNG